MAAKIFGLDIGRSFIKIVCVESSGSKKNLIAANNVPTPPGGVQSESPSDVSAIADSIRACLKSAKLGTNHCAISLIESQVVTRLIQLPNLTDQELSAAINWEAEQYIPLPIKDVSLQYKVVSRPSDQSGKMDVLLVAAPKRMVQKYLTIIKTAGLKAEAIETESASIARSLTGPTDPPTLIASMGAVSTELVIVVGGNVVFTRSIATGGMNLTKALIREFNLPANQAEQYKQTYGLLEDKLGGKVAAVIKPIWDILIAEVLKALEFARSHFSQSQLSRIIICGGGSYLPGLAEFLAARTSLEVSLGDPWANFVKEGVILKLAGQGSLYSVATGLALRE